MNSRRLFIKRLSMLIAGTAVSISPIRSFVGRFLRRPPKVYHADLISMSVGGEYIDINHFVSRFTSLANKIYKRQGRSTTSWVYQSDPLLIKLDKLDNKLKSDSLNMDSFLSGKISASGKLDDMKLSVSVSTRYGDFSGEIVGVESHKDDSTLELVIEPDGEVPKKLLS